MQFWRALPTSQDNISGAATFCVATVHVSALELSELKLYMKTQLLSCIQHVPAAFATADCAVLLLCHCIVMLCHPTPHLPMCRLEPQLGRAWFSWDQDKVASI